MTTPAVAATRFRPVPAGYGEPPPSRAPARPRVGGRTQQGGEMRISRARVDNAASSDRPQPESRSRREGKAPARPIGGSTRRASTVRASRSGGTLGGGSYQGVILAEYVAVILVIAVSPVARGQAKQGISPYAGTDMIKLAAATLLYMVLAFVSVAGHGPARVAAWLGGLTALAVGLAEGANISKDIGLFTGGLAAAAAGQPPAPAATGGGQLGQAVQGDVQAILNLPPSAFGPQQ